MVKKKPAAQAKTAENETVKVETKAAEKTTAAEKEAVKEVAKEVVKETAAAEEAPAKAEEKPAAKAAKTTRTAAKKTTTKKAAAPKKPAAAKKPAEKKAPAKAAKKEAEQEMKHIKNYMFIQEIRHGDRLQVFYNIDVDAMHVYIPRFILQPIVENAISHGLGNLTSVGTLEISAFEKKDRLYIQTGDVRFIIETDGID